MKYSFVVSRKGREGYDRLIAMNCWCEDFLGDRWTKDGEGAEQRWSNEFAFYNTDDFVRFWFANEGDAAMFSLKFSEFFLPDDEWKLQKMGLLD